jgi:hypothetical protein
MFILPTKWNFIAKSFEALSSILDRMYNDIYTEVLDIRTIKWIEVTFLNSWVNYGQGYNGAGYCKDGMGFVHLRGLVKDGTIDTTVFTLPVGYRPSAHELNIVMTNYNVFGRLDVNNNGDVVAFAPSSNVWVSLDGITFYAG